MGKLNQYEAATLGKFIGDLLVIAHWLFIIASCIRSIMAD